MTSSTGRPAWDSEPWRRELLGWLHAGLPSSSLEGVEAFGRLTVRSRQPWATVWRLDVGPETLYLKANRRVPSTEGRVQAVLAELAPEYVERPVAYDVERGWLLVRDAGPTLHDAEPESHGVAVETLVRLVRDYARLQRRTLGHRARLTAAGVPLRDPCGAAERALRQAYALADQPPNDPRHLPCKDLQRVRSALPALTEAGRRLAAGPIPQAFDHGDLWPGNTFPARENAPFRFFDLADAAWAHPFGSLVMLMPACIFHWEVPQPDDAIDLRDERIRAVVDAYLAEWAEPTGTPIAELRSLVPDALRIAALHRASAWLHALDTLDTLDTLDARTPERLDALADHGRMPWIWLEDVTKPVLL